MALLCALALWEVSTPAAHAYEFKLGDVTVDLQEITTNVDVYFNAMRFNRAANEWNVDVSVSNKVTQTFAGPLVLLVDSFTGTSGPLRPDGASTNQFFYDFSGRLSGAILLAGAKSGSRTIGLGFLTNTPPQLRMRTFAAQIAGAFNALAFTRSLNEVGQPLPAVSIDESGPGGSASNVTDSVFGVVTLGSAPGNYVWKFIRDGYLPVWRQGTLQTSQVALVSYAWLTPRNPCSYALSPLTGGVASNQTVAVQFNPGSFSANTQATLTGLGFQNLPAPLPQGWSPMQSFWLELGAEPSQPGTASLTPWGPIGATENAVLVKLDTAALAWTVLQVIPGNGTNSISALVPGSGAYALVVADAGPLAPSAPTVGQSLRPVSALTPDPASLLAGGLVIPATSPASTAPELVTAMADVSVTNVAASLSSGTRLRGEVAQSYLLQDGTYLTPPIYDEFVFGYQRPGDMGAGNLHARFPLRPVLLLSPQQLNQGLVHMDLFAPGAFTGGVLDTNGGLVASQPTRILAGPGTFQSLQAIELRTLNASNFAELAGTNFPVAAAFEVGVAAIANGQELSVQITGLPTNSSFVLARVLMGEGVFGLEPRKRVQSDGNGNLSSAEPTNGDRLPGLTGSGDYVLLQVQPQEDLVEGIAKNSNGQPTNGLPVRIAGQPWLTFSANDGSFKLLAPAGNGTMTIADLATGYTGTQAINVPTNLAPVSTSIASVANGLQVISITPTNGAVGVPQVSSVSVTFNRPLNPATLVSNALQLIGVSNQPVAATFSLNLANTTATLLPNTPLDPATLFTVVLATNVADALGRPLTGQNQFTFTTVALSARDPAAQLIIYEPGATNVATNVLAQIPGFVPGTNKNIIVVQGTPGSADPGVPVIIVNEASGETTTVLSKSDGSFASYVSGLEQDLISATFVSLNGARIYTPVNRQLFDDGTVGLFPQGGVLQATGDNGPVQVTVPPNAVTTRTKFKLGPINTAELQTQLGGVMPTKGTVAGGALTLQLQGPLPTLPLKVSFPVDLIKLGYPTNEASTNAAAVLAVVQNTQDITTFQIVDQMLFTPNRGPDRASKEHRPKGNEQVYAGVMDTALGFLPLLPGGQVAQTVFSQVLVPILFGPRPVVIKGKVGAVPMEVAIAMEKAGVLSQVLNLQMGEQTVNIPYVSDGVNLAVQLGYIKNPLNAVGTVFQLTLTALQQAEVAIAKPLSGAFITVQLSGGPLAAQPGHLFPGMVYATSGADGTFLTVAPAAGAQYLITCTHPLFDDIQQEPANPISYNPLQQGELSLAGVVFKNFLFTTPLLSQLQPNVNIAFSPVQPAAGQICEVQINAFEPPPLPPPDIHATLIGHGDTNLVTGLPETNVFAVLTNSVIVTNGNNVRWTGKLFVDKAVTAILKVFVLGASQNQVFGPAYITNAFTGPVPPIPVVNIPPPDTNDVHGPLVVRTDPVEHGYIGENATITVDFNKPIDASVTNNLAGITLSLAGTASSGSATQLAPILQLSPDQQSLVLAFPGLQPNQTYTLTLTGQSIRDLAGQPLDQQPSTLPADSFTLNFRTPSLASAPLPGLVNGRGSAIVRNRLYVLDQAPQDNYLLTYDITTPLQPQLLSRTHLFGVARDLVVVPQFRYLLDVHDQTIKTNDLVVVVGGDLDAQINQVQGTTVTVRGQYLWVMNMSDPNNPQILASPIVSYRVGSAVTKVRWAPPYLVYQEFGADVQLLGFVNLQELIIGYNSTPAEKAAFPDPAHRNAKNAGIDTDGDGEYVDPGETLPIPDLVPTEFYGKHESYVLQHTTQKILDFSVTPGGHTLGITLNTGVQVDDQGNANGPSLLPSYRTLVFGVPLNVSSPTDAMFKFGTGAYPRWVTVLDQLDIVSNNVPLSLAVALVSLQPDTNGVQTLAVLDISLPESPRLVNKIPIPDSLLGGGIQSVTLRSDGRLEVAGGQNLLLLDPGALAVTNVPAGELHPAIVDLIPAAGGITHSLGTTDYGIHAVADSGRGAVVESPPQMAFVSFPQSATLVDPVNVHLQDSVTVGKLFAAMRTTPGLAPARLANQTNLALPSDLEPPNPALHFHILASIPGGSAGANQTIQLGLESLNPAGRPLSNLGQGFAPVRAISDSAQQAIGQVPRPNCGAPIRSLTAYRMSDDPTSPFFNYYLSRPFALITEAVQLQDLARIKADGGPDREILFSGYALRAFLDPNPVQAQDPIVGPFTAQIDPTRKLIYPIASATAFTVNRSYITGDNPPPSGGYDPMDETFGTICAHSGESRVQAVDMALPSPNMPIQIQRAIGNQDTYEGPFGVGWDFNYNQRLTVLDPLTFPEGLQMPLVERDNQADSSIAGSQDVLFHSGLGETYHFRWLGTNMPNEYAQDPLVLQFDYQHLVSDYYLPSTPQGIFDLLVKFKDGRFERLTPDGLRFRYESNGRLETILDRFPNNRHEMQYDRNGWLVRIDDRSVTGPRYVLFGYYRRQNADPDFTANLDMDTSDPYLEGKICRLLDYAGGDVLFQYSSDGFLTNRLGLQVNGENGGYSGRSHTYYTYQNCKFTGLSATVNGTPLFSALSAANTAGKPVALSGNGIGGAVKFSIPVDNKAANLANQTSSVTLADKSSTDRKFDKWGHLTSITLCGATTTLSNNADGLLLFVQHPEGNTESMVYDSSNAVFRSRGNLLSRTVDPGPRGGLGYSETFQYDPRYNFKSGDQRNANGFVWTYQLRSDGREVSSIQYGSAGTETFVYNDNGQLTSSMNIRGIASAAVYDSATAFVSSRTLGQNTYTYSYGGDYASQLGQPASISLPEGAPIQFQYNANLQRTEETRGALIEDLAYDEQGRQILRQVQLGDGKVLTSRSVFDEKEFLKTNIVDNVEVSGQATSLEYDFTPDPLSRLQSIHYPQGTLQTFAYDCRGNVTNMTLGDYVEEYAYDLNDNRLSMKQGGDLVLASYYDGLDRATNTIRKTGSQDQAELMAYYPGGELQVHVLSDPQFGTVQQRAYDQIDELGRPLHLAMTGTTISPGYKYTYAPGSEKVDGPRMTTQTTWNDAGYDTNYSDPVLTQMLHPDGNGRVKQIDRLEDGAIYNDFFAYDDLDNRTSEGDNLGTKFLYLSRAEGSLLAITNALGHATTLDESVLGEILLRTRADGMQVLFQHDPERFPAYTGDPISGFHFTYDQDFRLTNSTLRNGSATLYTAFDPRNMPISITLPNGSETRQYDLQRRLTQRKVGYQSTTWEEDYAYDALNRVREETYIQNGGPNNTATFTYDEAGPLLQAQYNEDSSKLTVAYSYYDDGTRKSILYPSGVAVSENRDVSGRLIAVSDSAGNIISASSWQGNNQPKVVQLGTTITITNNYDARGRLTGSRITRLSDGAVLAHMRYQYDAADNLQIRQFIHRGGRADVFGFDVGERVTQEQIGVLLTNVVGLGPVLYQRQYSYHASGLDYLTSVIPSGPLVNAPPFATNWTAHDDFLLPTVVDGFNRGAADPMGTVAQAQLWVRPVNANAPQAISATLEHDGLGRLLTVTRADGVTIQNEYQPGGLRFARKILQGSQVTASSAYVYDREGRLLEEYDSTGSQPSLLARYYYAASDAPVAADLRDPGGQLQRYYLLRDAAMSVIAVADKNGNVVERSWYDAFGQPFIEQPDTAPPVVEKIVADAGGSLLISMSESVIPSWVDPGPGGGVSVLTNTLQNAFTFQGGITGAVSIVSSLPGTKVFSALRFTPSQVTTGTLTMVFNAGVLSDEWGNTNLAQTFALTNLGASPGTVYYSAQAQTDTSPVVVARSTLGSPFLFHGQYLDYDSGLIYLRARFYDPFSGMFLEPDPLGYEDSVNLYAGLGNNPVSARDPSGLAKSKVSGSKSEPPHPPPGHGAPGPNQPADAVVHPVARKTWTVEYYTTSEGSTTKGSRPTGKTANPKLLREASPWSVGSGFHVASGSRREAYVGGTPSKYSRAGREVLARMRGEDRIQGEGKLLPGNPNNLKVKDKEGNWHRIDETIDMGHLEAAVSWWNQKGYALGPKRPEVRQFMLNANNYEFQPRSQNRSEGAAMKEEYVGSWVLGSYNGLSKKSARSSLPLWMLQP